MVWMIFEAKALIAGIMLAVASYQDFRTREIDDKVWLIGGGLGGALTAYEALFTPAYPYLLAGFSIGITAALAFGVYYLGLYGGADAKALLAIALTFPLAPSWITSPLFPIAVLGNSLLLSVLLLIPTCLALNLAWKVSGRSLFDGVEAPWVKKAAAMLTGVRVRPAIARKVHFNLMEVPAPKCESAGNVQGGGGEENDGNERVRLKLFSRVTDEDEEKVIDDRRDYVWVTPAIPMIVFFLAGYISALLGWDILFAVVSLLI